MRACVETRSAWMLSHEPLGTSNIQHRTFNNQTAPKGGALDAERSMLNVGCFSRMRWGRARARIFVAIIIEFLTVVTAHRAWAQPTFGLSAIGTPDPVLLTQPLTYSILLTNLETFSVPGIFVTNHFSAATLYVTRSEERRVGKE